MTGDVNARVGAELLVVPAYPCNCRNQLVKHREQSSAVNAYIVEVQANIIQAVFNQPWRGEEVIACAAYAPGTPVDKHDNIRVGLFRLEPVAMFGGIQPILKFLSAQA